MNILTLIFAYLLALLMLLPFPLVIIASIVNKKREKREQEEFKKKMQQAVKDIMADGKVEGPKGKYVPHKGQGSLTDRSTSPPRHSGYYHHPWS